MASLNRRKGPLGKQNASHLLRRCTYRITKEQIDKYSNIGVNHAVNALFNFPKLQVERPLHPLTGKDWTLKENAKSNKLMRDSIKSWWLNEALHDSSIQSKMMFFLHSNFITDVQAGTPYHFYNHLRLLRHYAGGSFKTLALKMITDKLMLRYLNNDKNTKTNPNENFAREFLELFTIGKGPQIGEGNYTNYTESDITEAARLLTGFVAFKHRPGIDPDTKIPRGRPILDRHDTGSKTFSAAFNNKTIKGAKTTGRMFDELEEFVEMVFAQPETAKTICRKLYRFFVYSNGSWSFCKKW